MLILLALLTALAVTGAAAAEGAEGQEEQGLDEIQPLVEMNDVTGTEGMSLGELTDAFREAAMGEYYDSATGFSMQYPSVFQFDEEDGSTARTEDGTASLSIENMGNDGSLTEDMLMEAIRIEAPDAELQKIEQNGCIRMDRKTDEGRMVQTDLYLVTENSFHHIILRYPVDQQELYIPYIEYMINTFSNSETEQG